LKTKEDFLSAVKAKFLFFLYFLGVFVDLYTSTEYLNFILSRETNI